MGVGVSTNGGRRVGSWRRVGSTLRESKERGRGVEAPGGVRSSAWACACDGGVDWAWRRNGQQPPRKDSREALLR
jgi:hypothetical protein